MKTSRFLWGVGLLSLALRIIFALRAPFSGDEIYLYGKSLDFYLTGKLATTGARVVYTETMLPGALQDLLMGLPLFISRGLPWGIAVFVALVNWVSTILIYGMYRGFFPKTNPRALALLIFFAPWTFVYTNIFNPAFVPLLAVAFYLGVFRLMREPRSFWAAFWVGVSIPAMMQMNLCFVALAATFAFLLMLGLIPLRDAWKGYFAGGVSAGLGLLPYVLEHVGGHAGKNPFLSKNISFEWVHFTTQYKIFFRFITFATGETTRFLGGPSGFGGACRLIARMPVLWIPALIGLPLSAWMAVVGVRFFFRRRLYAQLGRLLSDRGAAVRLSFESKVEITVLLSLLCTMGLYLLAFKEPSAHTLLMLLPLAFYPFLRETSATRFPVWAVGVYAASVVIYTTLGIWAANPASLWETQRRALDRTENSDGTVWAQGVSEIRRALNSKR